MRNFIAAGAVAVLAITTGVAGQGGCRANKGFMEAGNYYCDSVKHIHYTGVSQSGTYNKVVDMKGCQTEPHKFDGPMAPFNEEGPLHLKRFAVYTPGSSKKRSASVNHRRHDHQHFHAHNKEIREIQEREAKGEDVTVTMDGKVTHWTNNYDGGSANAAPAAPAPAAPAPNQKDGATPSSVEKAAAAAPSFNAGTGSWGRQAYYSATDGVREGLVFLNTTWDGSLAYASADGSGNVASPATLKDMVLADANEIIIMSDKLCSNGECGAVHPKSVAHHGFGGAEKAFLMEFSMPLSGNKGAPGQYTRKLDQPKIWALNAHIPRTGQFDGCSCWRSGCGEFDLFETLTEGGTRCKSTFHMEKMGGNSDYFDRPTAKTITAAVIFTGESGSAHIKVLDAGHSFDKSLAASDIENLCKDTHETSVFDVSKLPNANGQLPL